MVVPDARSAEVRTRIAAQAARLNPESEADALRWIEAVSGWMRDESRRRRHRR
ncbi:MAG: hypothetical protein JO032_11465 [Alphaproteobacteria bacterium]|nr:hypothetical protein [Alphaproteobacteria bacterium]